MSIPFRTAAFPEKDYREVASSQEPIIDKTPGPIFIIEKRQITLFPSVLVAEFRFLSCRLTN
jgi:hypothetical protein